MHGHPYYGLFVAWTGLVVTSSFSNLGPSDIVVVIGALGFAYATLRTSRAKALRDTNADLISRNDLLERERESNKEEMSRLRGQSNDELAKLLQGLVRGMENHDENMKRVADEQITILREIRNSISSTR